MYCNNTDTCPNSPFSEDYVFPQGFESCNNIFTGDNLNALGYNSFFDGENFRLSLDMVSVMTAVSLNVGEFINL